MAGTLRRRPTIADVARAAGVSVATVDRVLNGRHPVREDTARRVVAAAEAIGFHATQLLKSRIEPDQRAVTLGFVLQKAEQEFYQMLAASLKAATEEAPGVRGRALIEFAPELSAAATAERLAAVGRRADVVAVVSVDHPTVGQVVDHLRQAGVPTFALLTGLTVTAFAGYVGIDNRKAGRMAAWAIARTARAPGEVGILVGSHRYLGHELREIGFRSYFREHAPQFRVLDALVNLEEPRIAHEATLDLLKRYPGLAGMCVAGGGMEGVIEAFREATRRPLPALVVNELITKTRAALLDDIATLVITTPIPALARRTVDAMIRAAGAPAEESARQHILPFEIHTAENI